MAPLSLDKEVADDRVSQERETPLTSMHTIWACCNTLTLDAWCASFSCRVAQGKEALANKDTRLTIITLSMEHCDCTEFHAYRMLLSTLTKQLEGQWTVYTDVPVGFTNISTSCHRAAAIRRNSAAGYTSSDGVG